MVLATLVALESLTQAIAVPYGDRLEAVRDPGKVRSPSTTASRSMPRARQTAAVAMALRRLCSPGRAISVDGMRGSSAHHR